MKKSLLFAITIWTSVCGYAQHIVPGHPYQETTTIYPSGNTVHFTTARTTAVGDTTFLSNIAAADSALVLYTEGANDTNGYLTGTDSFNDEAFAERYDFDGADSSVIVLGVLAQFGGTVNPASTQVVTFKIWQQGDPVVVYDSLSYSGYPTDVLDTVQAPVTQLGIGPVGDTLKAFLFATPTVSLQNSFFAGYSINYNFSALGGDTIGLASSVNGDRTSPVLIPQSNTETFVNPYGTDSIATVYDTVINIQNATMQSDGNWYDNYTQDDSLLNDLAIYPIVYVGTPSGIKGITKNNLTFFGNYPNPAVNTTNIKFSLSNSSDVTIQIMDMAGHTLQTIAQSNLGMGEHLVPVNTSSLPAGNYLYLILTSGGGGMASELTVIK